MNNIYILNKNYKQIGVLSNQGANPQAPYYDDLYVQELDTGADTYQFSTISSKYTQDLLEIGNHVMFSFNNRNEIFTITSLEYSHYEGYKTIGVYAEGIGFELLEVFMERPPIKKYPNSGNDSDGDGDDNTDDEYGDPDDIYIDENGNIIYDENGSGPPSEDDVYIDEDGFIIYKPDRKKEKNDSLEFKNISFPTFLKILLKNTGWNYTCQSGLSSVKHNINVRYDTNIYAVLQDSMQAYRGVELEFVHEMRNGKVQKIVKAYKDGGRGSVVGKRFEYGTNVKGITKTQEVTDSEDDTVLYVDDVGVKVYYDVDFALKSAEIPEIEIGDTHYVIDKDFYPPMTIKARIGKIEISFTDPTKNKIYLANNKNIRGSSDEEDIRDILDDYFNDPGYDDDPGSGDDDVPDHDHNCLRAYKKDSYVFLRQDILPETYTCPFTGYEYTHRLHLDPDAFDAYSAIGGENSSWNFIYGDWVKCKRVTATDSKSVISKNIENSIYVDSLGVRSTRYMVKMPNNRIENATTMSTKDLYDFIKNLTICKYTNKEETALLDDGNSYTFGIYNADSYADSESPIAEGIFRKLYENLSSGNPERNGSGYIQNSLLCALIGAFQHVANGGSNPGGDDGGSNPGDGGLGIPEGVITYTEDPIPGNGYRLDFNADRTYVNDLLIANDGMNVIGDLNVLGNILLNGKPIAGDGSGSDPSNPGGGELPSGNTITVKKIIGGNAAEGERPKYVEIEDALAVKKIFHPEGDGSVEWESDLDVAGTLSVYDDTHIDGDLYVYGQIINENSNGYAYDYLIDSNCKDKTVDDFQTYVKVMEGTTLSNGNVNFGSVTLCAGEQTSFQRVAVCLHFSQDTSAWTPYFGPGYGDSNEIDLGRSDLRWKTIYATNSLNTCDIKYKENIIYLDDLLDSQTYSLNAQVYSSNEVETPFLDFIKNDFKPALYNYKSTAENGEIRQQDNQLGFIANDIIDTEIGGTFLYDFGEDEEQDIMVSASGYTTVVARALQEEIRTRDEKIASLEARLAKIEEMLGINNN